MARCDLTDLDTTACAHCLGHTDPETDTRREHAQLLATGRWTPAQFPGTCEHCGESFTPRHPDPRGDPRRLACRLLRRPPPLTDPAA